MQSSRALVIFDLDGTLVDSVSQIGISLNKARKDLSYPELPQLFYNKNIGLPIENLIADLDILDYKKVELITRFRGYLVSEIRLGNNPVYPGVLEVLQRFMDMKVSLAIATSKPTQVAELVYENSLLSRFPFFIQGTDGFPPKPNPEVICRVLLHFPDTLAVMVGDRSEDMVAATRAEISAIGIAAGAHSKQTLSETGASIVFSDFSEFAKQLDTYFDQISGIFK